MYLCTGREIWTSFSCLVLLKCYHVVFSQFKIPANLAQLAVPKMHCLYGNAVVQPSMQHCPCYMAWKTNVHTWCRHRHLCINAPMWREKRWLQGLFDPPSYSQKLPFVSAFELFLMKKGLVKWHLRSFRATNDFEDKKLCSSKLRSFLTLSLVKRCPDFFLISGCKC